MVEDLEPLFKIFYAFVCKKVLGKITDKYNYGKSKASPGRNLSNGTPPKSFSTILCFVALVYKSYFFSEQPFDGNYSALDFHINTVISHTFAYSSKMASKTVKNVYCKSVSTFVKFDHTYVLLNLSLLYYTLF